MYDTILDALDFLYKVLAEEPFVKKKILGDIPILHGSAKHLYRYGGLLLEQFVCPFLHAVIIATLLGESVLELFLCETEVLLLSRFCMKGEFKWQGTLRVGNGKQ